MHAVIRKRLEDLIDPRRCVSVEPGLDQHLQECSGVFGGIGFHEVAIGSVSGIASAQGCGACGGFYARVLQRIEERSKESVWAALLRSPFSARLTYASLTLTVLLGSYVIASETRDGHLMHSDTVIAQNTHFDAPVIGSVAQQRDAVLANFAVH